MKILITGATGFIGQHLIQRLLTRGDSVAILVRTSSHVSTLTDRVKIIQIPETQTMLENIFESEKFDGVIHLASLYLMSHKSEEIDSLIDSNIKFGVKVLDAACKTGTQFFINTNSFMQHYENRAYSPTNLYAATKQAFQDLLQYYVETTKTIFLTLELYNTFGPGDTRSKVFTLWEKAVKEGRTLDMSPGEQIIDISYIDNVIDGYLTAIANVTAKNGATISGHSYTLMSPERMTLKELAKVFAEELECELKVNFGALPYRDRENMTPMNEGQILPGWTAKVSLREGIRRTFFKKA